jgi:multidrug efflux pump subunit AcrB
MLIVEKLPWANTLDVTRGVEEALEELKPGLSGIEIDSEIFRPATFIELAIDNLLQSLLLGSVLVVLVIFACLWDFRIALISCVVIPVSMMAALLVGHLTCGPPFFDLGASGASYRAASTSARAT